MRRVRTLVTSVVVLSVAACSSSDIAVGEVVGTVWVLESASRGSTPVEFDSDLTYAEPAPSWLRLTGDSLGGVIDGETACGNRIRGQFLVEGSGIKFENVTVQAGCPARNDAERLTTEGYEEILMAVLWADAAVYASLEDGLERLTLRGGPITLRFRADQ